ncbi:thiol-disulfide oxidoreductase [Sphingomonas naphthae]|uniref:Thiol-disulfide oxidoreductase n=1 Tax=Sphingomonas naphthae TaxID=1813468 RepID=A0ABY7TKS2_9SPHN|nr:thiol-disulfide oxidoreductase [Sphingomonas naphthae]WCT73833.1 thiol-disulfide oxidoreductase [Sphingomonas naphthae]
MTAIASEIPFFRIGPRVDHPPAADRYYDGLTAFAPMWAIAALFSIAGDPKSLLIDRGPLFALFGWATVAASVALLLYPRKTWLLVTVAACAVMLYLVRLPVASNNKTITTVMNLGILLSCAVACVRQRNGIIDRGALYQQVRVVARALLAIMYFYGIYHKINTDFLDPSVSCAVGLYAPLARPFGLDDNLVGRYLAIYSTFVVEAVAIVCLYWRRYFALGFIPALVFHYIIPISAFSWYMDFSSLVFALYALSMPTAASRTFYETTMRVTDRVRHRFGRIGTLFPAIAAILAALVVVSIAAILAPGRPPMLLIHSMWILVWAVVGGVVMVLLSYAALLHTPYTGPAAPRQPLWLFAVPGLFFLTCLSPYLGLKTESSIAMFSNLHTEGGQTNHLMFDTPPYLFDYQQDVVRVLASSDAALMRQAAAGSHHVLFTIRDRLRRNPAEWVTYEQGGRVYERMTSASFARQPGLIERNLLIFKPVDYRTPKVCTH